MALPDLLSLAVRVPATGVVVGPAVAKLAPGLPNTPAAIVRALGRIRTSAFFGTDHASAFAALAAALAQLDAEGCFGADAQRDDFVLLFEVSDSEPVEGAMARLNPPAVVARFAAWMASWAD
jgi:hypothetical protein